MLVCLSAICVTPQLHTFAQSRTLAQSVQGSGVGVTAVNRPPNILFIITDQQHADMMSCAGNKNLKTPAMGSLSCSMLPESTEAFAGPAALSRAG
jgi:hypothetical protein